MHPALTFLLSISYSTDLFFLLVSNFPFSPHVSCFHRLWNGQALRAHLRMDWIQWGLSWLFLTMSSFKCRVLNLWACHSRGGRGGEILRSHLQERKGCFGFHGRLATAKRSVCKVNSEWSGTYINQPESGGQWQEFGWSLWQLCGRERICKFPEFPGMPASERGLGESKSLDLSSGLNNG